MVIEYSFNSELEPVASFEHCLSVDKRHRTNCVAAKNYLPDSVEFGKLRTFRDLAVVVAAGSDAESSTCG